MSGKTIGTAAAAVVALALGVVVAATPEKLMDPAKLTEKAPATYKAKFDTTKGTFVIEVTRDWAPQGADRFYNLVKSGYFDEVKFFRVVPGFVVQFGIHGDPAVSSKWRSANIKDDPVKESNKRGSVTFATAGPNTRTTQLFINLNDHNTQLDSKGFAPIGKVVSGMDVVEKLYDGYAEGLTQLQGRITNEGNAFLEKNYPNLDGIKKATIE